MSTCILVDRFTLRKSEEKPSILAWPCNRCFSNFACPGRVFVCYSKDLFGLTCPTPDPLPNWAGLFSSPVTPNYFFLVLQFTHVHVGIVPAQSKLICLFSDFFISSYPWLYCSHSNPVPSRWKRGNKVSITTK